MANLSAASWREACKKAHGNKSEIARYYDKSRQWVYNQLKKDKYREIYESSKEASIEFVESQLMKHIKTPNDGMGDLSAIKFYLQTIGKDRGWSTRTEITGKDGADLFGGLLDADVVDYLQKQGLTPEDVMSESASQFNEMIRAMMLEDA